MTSSISATLRWIFNGDSVEHQVSFTNDNVLLSGYYLQSLLPPICKFIGLKAIIECEQSQSEINISPIWDLDGHDHYLIQSTLSRTYVVVHSNDCVYVSDSLDSFEDGMESFSINTPGCSKTIPMCIDQDSDGHEDIEAERACENTIVNEDMVTVQLDCGTKDNSNLEIKSIVQWIMENPGATRLKKLLAICGAPNQVDELPVVYDGTICFELPVLEHGKQKRMHGMEQKFDGHLWSRPSQTNMAIDCIVRLSYCLGNMQCHRVTCSCYINDKKYNDTFFHGHLDRQVSKGYPACEGKTKITCHYCNQVVTCSAVCTCMIYYVFPKERNMTRLVIHVGEHAHNVKQGTKRASIEKVKSLVNAVLKIEKGGPRKIQMLVARQMLFQSLIKEDETETTDKDLNHFLEEMMPLVENKGYEMLPLVDSFLSISYII